MQPSSVWFVTGASKGLGLILVQKLLAAGYRVAATSRRREALVQEAGETSAQFLPLQVDLGNETSVRQAIEATVGHFGRLDIVVNNAGFGQVGTLEELTDAEVRNNFEVNVFGVLNVIRHAMPYLRAQRSGHIVDISSVGGYVGGFAGWGIYCATKFAVVGFTEALAAEAKGFGVHATVVYPGYFRTSFLTQDSLAVPAQPIAAYEEARASQTQHQAEINGNQPGDPAKAVDVLIQLVSVPNPPVHLFLGQDAYDMVAHKNALVQQDMDTWRELATATALDNAQTGM